MVEKFTKKVGLTKYALCVQDYGAPVGYRLAVRRPERVTGLVVQNGNAYDEGLARIMHLAIIPTAIVSFGRVLVGADRRKPSDSCAKRLAQLLERQFSPPSADPRRRQPPGLLALGPLPHMGEASADAGVVATLPSNRATKTRTAS